ncbi:hypothetical protein BpHYR1_032596 [Brachionus plicatilis]|uniref:Uncharacterized protein n=1 Tax=Brachionus plicatilis TaxID=10195 RepID=A0A3M7QYP2_BRAPC|nr:hypothetical protein BpHYR1_032596 [Brachionus plicatilis]
MHKPRCSISNFLKREFFFFNKKGVYVRHSVEIKQFIFSTMHKNRPGRPSLFTKNKIQIIKKILKFTKNDCTKAILKSDLLLKIYQILMSPWAQNFFFKFPKKNVFKLVKTKLYYSFIFSSIQSIKALTRVNFFWTKNYPGFPTSAHPSPYEVTPVRINFCLLSTVSLTKSGPPESP